MNEQLKELAKRLLTHATAHCVTCPNKITHKNDVACENSRCELAQDIRMAKELGIEQV